MSVEITSGAEVGEWVATRICGSYNAKDSQAIGLKRRGELVAGVIYEAWNHKSIVCHIAIEGCMTPTYVGAIFDYPFRHCAVDKIIAPVAESNKESLRLLDKMGFAEEARIKDAHPEGDLLFYTLAHDACRFLGEKYGQR